MNLFCVGYPLLPVSEESCGGAERLYEDVMRRSRAEQIAVAS